MMVAAYVGMATLVAVSGVAVSGLAVSSLASLGSTSSCLAVSGLANSVVTIWISVHSRNTINVIGLLAGTLTTLSFLPQAVKTWRQKSARELSDGMLAAFSSGVVLWLIYGLALGALPIILANALTLALLLVIIFLKIKYERRD